MARARFNALSPKAILFGAVFGSVAAFIVAPDMTSVTAGDDAGIHSFFATEASRRRAPPTRLVTPQAAPARAVASAPRLPASRAAAYAQPYAPPSPNARAYATAFEMPFAPAVGAIDAAFPTQPSTSRGRHASTRQHAAPPLMRDAAAPFEPMGRRAVCVRLCDGFHFPLGAVRSGADLRDQANMCGALCPGAPARLYVMPSGSEKIEDAVSLEGRRYDLLPVAFRHASTRDNACSCRPAGASLSSPLVSLLDDVTLRRGDIVMTGSGVRVFRGATRWPLRQGDFVKAANIKMSSRARAALATLDRLAARDRREREMALEAAALSRRASGGVL
jgi:hypothetical protein